MTAVTSNTPLKGFFSSIQTCGLVDVNQPLPWFSGDSFLVSRALGGTCRRLSNILLLDLTPLHVKITRSDCRRKLKLSTYLHTVSYNHVRFLNRPCHGFRRHLHG